MAKKSKVDFDKKEGIEQSELFDMDGAIAFLKTTRPTFARWLKAGKINGFKAGRQWRFEREELERFLRGENPKVDVPLAVEDLIGVLVNKLEENSASVDVGDPDRVGLAVNLIMRLANALRASDLHITYHDSDDGVKLLLRMRVEGSLIIIGEFDSRLMLSLMERFKSLSKLNLGVKDLPQDGKYGVKWDDGSMTDFRVCVIPVHHGEEATIRILDKSTAQIKLDSLGLVAEDVKDLRDMTRLPNGLIIFTGPTGCGKTTSMYACLQELANGSLKVMSLEDPVEYTLPWVSQMQMNPKTGMDFSRGIRANLRSDPDVMMVGEIRNSEVLHMTFEAAMTGHLIFSAMHTDQASGALVRMKDMGGIPFVICDTAKVIVGMRLLRKVCPDCSDTYTPEALYLDQAAKMMLMMGQEWHNAGDGYRRGKGCKSCRYTGFQNRQPLVEILKVTPAVSSVFIQGGSEDEIRSAAIREGMVPMVVRGIELAKQGVLSLEEVLRYFTFA